MNNFKTKLYNLKISSKLPFWCIAPIVILIVAIIVFSVFTAKTDSVSSGLGLGIDFTGGTEMTIMVEDNAQNEKTIRKIVANRNNAPIIDYLQGINTGGTDGVRIQYKNSIKDATAMKELNDQLKSDLSEAFGGVNVDYTSRSSTASADLIKKAVIATVVALILIMIYIIIRFEWLSGVSAIAALLHDLVIMTCLTIIFRIPINSSFVAAIITIVAYSINNTIVVFDRVRERKKMYDKKTIVYNEVIDEAIVMTFNRTILTSITTLIMVIMLTILGVASMRYFTLPILFGLIAGTYSSLFLSPPLWAAMNNGIIRYRAKKYQKYKSQK